MERHVACADASLGEFRDDLYVPLCYDAAGAATYLKAIMDTAALRAHRDVLCLAPSGTHAGR